MANNGSTQTIICPHHTVTPAEGHYFFGYYDKCPWDPSGKLMLALRTSFMDRPPTAADRAEIGLIELEANNKFHPLDSTTAWNWQQGCMLRWMPTGEIIYNTRVEGSFSAVILNIHTGKKRFLPSTVYSVCPSGKKAVTLNFSRVHKNRPGYGYAGIDDLRNDISAPADDGIYLMDIETGESRLAISIESIVDKYAKPIMKKGYKHWFNHLEFNPAGKRFVFLHRWREEENKPLTTQFFSANADGSDIHCLADDGMTSHFGWLNESKILAWARIKGIGDRCFLFTDKTPEFEIIGEGLLKEDGHCSYSPDKRWILTDTYPDENDGKRALILYRESKKEMIIAGRFYGPFPEDKTYRCDLHPRWNRDGNMVCFDSFHEGTRKIYVADVSKVVA